MKQSALDSLPQDYFEYKIAQSRPRHKQNLLAPLLVYALFFLFIPTNYLDGDIPAYVRAGKYVWLGLCAVYAVGCVFYSTKRGRPSVYTLLTACSMGLFLIEFWLILSHFALVLCCMAGGNSLDPARAAVVFALSILALFGGVLAYIFVYRRVKKRVIQGHYRRGGKGFWDNHGIKHKLLRILAAVAPVCVSFSVASIVFGRFSRVTWDAAYTPVVAVVGPLLFAILVLPFSYGNAISVMQIYYARRFGDG